MRCRARQPALHRAPARGVDGLHGQGELLAGVPPAWLRTCPAVVRRDKIAEAIAVRRRVSQALLPPRAHLHWPRETCVVRSKIAASRITAAHDRKDNRGHQRRHSPCSSSATNNADAMAPSFPARRLARDSETSASRAPAVPSSADADGAAGSATRRLPTAFQQLGPGPGIVPATFPHIVVAGPWPPRHAATRAAAEVQGLEHAPYPFALHPAPHTCTSSAL